MNQNLTHAFFQQTEKTPSAICLELLPQGRKWTFQECCLEINRWRGGLNAQFQRGDRILILFRPSAELFFVILACFSEGLVPFLVDPRLPRKYWFKALKNQNLKGMISEKKLLKWKFLFPNFWFIPSFVFEGSCFFSKSIELLKSELSSFKPLVEIQDNEPSLITLTSGTTGAPKLIQRNFGALYHQQRMATKYLPKLDRDLHLAGYVVSILQSFGENAENIFITETNPTLASEVILQREVTRLSGPPGFIMEIAQELILNKQTRPQIKSLLVGGAPISRFFYETCRQVFPSAQVTIIYGATESEPISFITDPAIEGWSHGYPVGKFIPELEVHKKHIEVFGLNNTFEVGLSGRHVVGEKKYWTGDLATEIEGNIFHLGRIQDLIDIAGIKYCFSLIEGQLEGKWGIRRLAFKKIHEFVYCFYDLLSEEADCKKIENEICDEVLKRGYPIQLRFRMVKEIPVDQRHRWKIQRRELM